MHKLPEAVAEKISQMPEYSYGANLVTLSLRDGRKVYSVIVGGDYITKIEQELIKAEDVLSFSPSDVVDAERQIGYYN